MSTVKLFDVRWVSHTAGPSPIKTKFGSNARTELFFMGCKKAAEGKPCENCFNPLLWQTIKGARELNPKDMASHIDKFAPQKYVTIVGGEPFDQPEGLTILCEELRKRDFHIMVFTHYSLQGTFRMWKKYELEQRPECRRSIKRIVTLLDSIEGWTFNLFVRFLQSIDILVDGEYEQDKRIYDESSKDGFHDAIGSSNQIVWDLRTWRETGFSDVIRGQRSDNILQMGIREADNSLVFIVKHDLHKVFPLILNSKSVQMAAGHTKWFTDSYQKTIDITENDLYRYYYKYDYLDSSVVRNDIKRDIRSYGSANDIGTQVIESLCESVDDSVFLEYNEPWLNTLIDKFDQEDYELSLNSLEIEGKNGG